MASQGGLTRRRGGGGGGGQPSVEDESNDTSRVNSPAPRNDRYENRGPETSYESSENGHKIAFDPRDISESAERSKQPKLTLMEEVLLLGLKDKQVWGNPFCKSHGIPSEDIIWAGRCFGIDSRALTAGSGLSFVLERQHILRAAGLYRD